MPAFGKPTRPTSATVRSTSSSFWRSPAAPRVISWSSSSLSSCDPTSSSPPPRCLRPGRRSLPPLPAPRVSSPLSTHGPPAPPVATTSRWPGATRSPSTRPPAVRTKVPGGTGTRSSRASSGGAAPSVFASAASRCTLRVARTLRSPGESVPRSARGGAFRECRWSRSQSAVSTTSTTLPPLPPPGGSSKSPSAVRASRGPPSFSFSTWPSPPPSARAGPFDAPSKKLCASFAILGGGFATGGASCRPRSRSAAAARGRRARPRGAKRSSSRREMTARSRSSHRSAGSHGAPRSRERRRSQPPSSSCMVCFTIFLLLGQPGV